MVCRRGRCHSYIEGDSIVDVLAASPGMLVKYCDRGGCSSGAVFPPPLDDITPTYLVRQESLGDVEQGIHVGDAGSYAVRLDSGVLSRHVLVTGATGSGKTYTTAHLSYCGSIRDYSVVILDWHIEYGELFERFGVSVERVLVPVSIVDPVMPAEVSASILEQALELSPQQTLLLLPFLDAARIGGEEEAAERLLHLESILAGRVFDDVKRVVRVLSKTNTVKGLLDAVKCAYRQRQKYGLAKGEVEVWAALIRKLSIIAGSPNTASFFKISRDYERHPLTRVLRGPGQLTVIEVGIIPGSIQRRLYQLLLLETLFQASQLSRGNDVRALIAVDEAQNMLTNPAVVEELLSEARKYGISLLLVTHTPRILPAKAQANLNTLIIHRTVASDDIAFLGNIIGREYAALLPKLEKGTAIVHAPALGEPIVVKVPMQLTKC